MIHPQLWWWPGALPRDKKSGHHAQPVHHTFMILPHWARMWVTTVDIHIQRIIIFFRSQKTRISSTVIRGHGLRSSSICRGNRCKMRAGEKMKISRTEEQRNELDMNMNVNKVLQISGYLRNMQDWPDFLESVVGFALKGRTKGSVSCAPIAKRVMNYDFYANNDTSQKTDLQKQASSNM